MYQILRGYRPVILFIAVYLSIVFLTYSPKGAFWNEMYLEKSEYWPLKIWLADTECELRLDFKLGNETLPKFTILDTKVLEKGGKSVSLSYEDLVQIPDSKWKKNFDPMVQLVYPQAYNISEVIRRLRNGQTIPEVSFHTSFVHHFTKSTKRFVSSFSTPLKL